MTARMRPVAEQKTARLAEVCRAGTGGAAGADHPRMSERGGHAVILEAAGGFSYPRTQEQLARVETDEAATMSARWRIVWPSPIVSTFSRGAKGNRSGTARRTAEA